MIFNQNKQTSFSKIVFSVMILSIPLLIAACIHDDTTDLGPTYENNVLKISHSVPSSVKVGEEFTVTINVEVKKSIQALSVREALSGLKLSAQGDFIGLDKNTLRGFILNPSAGEMVSLSYTAQCEHPITYTITGFADTKNARTVWESAEINCTE
jgi:hypothetical protein